jgi:hypothetical protein
MKSAKAYRAPHRKRIFRSTHFYAQLANPKPLETSPDCRFPVEMWDRTDQHIRWVISVSSGVAAKLRRGSAVGTSATRQLSIQRPRPSIEIMQRY